MQIGTKYFTPPPMLFIYLLTPPISLPLLRLCLLQCRLPLLLLHPSLYLVAKEAVVQHEHKVRYNHDQGSEIPAVLSEEGLWRAHV